MPGSNLLGEEGGALAMAISKLAEERLSIAVFAVNVAEAALGWTVEFTKQRKAFGRAICDFQNTPLKLAELRADTLENVCSLTAVSISSCASNSLR